jgi:hypothetical protein
MNEPAMVLRTRMILSMNIVETSEKRHRKDKDGERKVKFKMLSLVVNVHVVLKI